MKYFKYIPFLLLLFFISMMAGCASTRNMKKSSEESSTHKQDKDEGLKPFSKVITDEAKTDKGLFTVYKVDGKYYYEIPDSLIGKSMLLVSRIAKTANGIDYGGTKVNTQTVKWQKKNDDILLRSLGFENVADKSLPIYKAVRRSNFAPVIASFDIESLGKDSSGVVIDVTDLFSSDVPSLGLPSSTRKKYKVHGVDGDRTFINYIHSFPKNIEVRTLLTYKASKPPSNSSTGTISVVMNQSMVLLPKEKMQTRSFDQRVGYFSVRMTDYGVAAQKAKKVQYITRYKLIPKDKEAYLNGKLVEPVHPIVYYIDRATPKKWRPYLINGIEAWNKAFRAAGFKHAIIAKVAPKDSSFDPGSVTNSVLRYYASPIQNAYGPNVHDPRTGQILEADIGWYHNVMTLLRHWYFIQTAAANPKARKVTYSTKLMGRLLQMVATHEVGHTLGLQHNMASSNAFPVDSLRSPAFTATHGTAPSIMDYARFNYIAQPGDGVTNFIPRIGKYDKWAIKWGYTWFPKSMSSEKIERTLDKWIAQRDSAIYHWGVNSLDPRSNTEDLGRNAMKASRLGIKNLKIIINHLVKWTARPYTNFDELKGYYKSLVNQWNLYMGHVSALIGGVYQYDRTYSGEGPVYVFVDEAKQRKAMDFLKKYCFETPKWLLDEDVLSLINQDQAVDMMRQIQVNVLDNILDPQRIARLIEYNARYKKDTYTAIDMMDQLRKGVWSELSTHEPISVYRRDLQLAYLERMKYLMTHELPDIPDKYKQYIGWTHVNVSQSDIRPIVRSQLKILLNNVEDAEGHFNDRITEAHLQAVKVRINNILHPDK